MLKTREGTLAQHVKLSMLTIGSRAQRALDERRAQRIANDFDWDLFGIIQVAKRSDGTMRVIDGQHRVVAARLAGISGNVMVPCAVHESLSDEREAQLFLGLSNAAAIKPLDKFLIGVVAHEPEAFEVNKIVESLGIHVRDTSMDMHTAAVTALRKVYRLGPDVLREALVVILDSWGGTKDSLRGQVIEGVGLVLARYGYRCASGASVNDNLKVDTGSLSRKLSTLRGGPSGLISRGKQASELFGMTVPKGIAQVIVGEYNKGRKPANRLPDWERKA